MNAVSKPVAQPSPMTQPFWDAAAQGRFVLQTCSACGTVRHYPRLLCTQCYGDQHVWQDSPAVGKIHSWTHAHHAFHAGFAHDIPYTLVTVDLDEGVRSLGIWKGPAGMAIGMRVKGRYIVSSDRVDWVFEPLGQ